MTLLPHAYTRLIPQSDHQDLIVQGPRKGERVESLEVEFLELPRSSFLYPKCRMLARPRRSQKLCAIPVEL